MIKKTLITLMVILVAIFGCYGCNNHEESHEQELFLLYKTEIYGAPHLVTAKRSDGNCAIDPFSLTWNDTGCSLIYEDMGKTKEVFFDDGEKKEINLFAIPINLEYEAFLSYEGCQLPDSWIELLAEAESKEQAKSQFSDRKDYEDSRNKKKELSIIQEAFDQSELYQNPDEWYQAFIKATWIHGDVSIAIVKAKATETADPNIICLIITDQNGNEMVLYGSRNDFVDAISYKGKRYAGPYSG